LRDDFHKWAQTVANVTVVFTLILGLTSIWYQWHQAKRVRSFEMVARLNDGILFQAQSNFLREIIQLPLGDFKDEVIDRDFMRVLFERLVETSDDPDQLAQDTIALVGYFDDVQICIESGSCNEAVMRLGLADRAVRFACLTMPYVKSIREQYLLDGLGDGLVVLSRYEQAC